MSNPTTAPVKIITSNEIPLAFSFCKFLYAMNFDGNFSTHTHTSIKNISVLHGDSEVNLLLDGNLSFERVSYINDPLMCKEFIMPEHERARLESSENIHMEKEEITKICNFISISQECFTCKNLL